MTFKIHTRKSYTSWMRQLILVDIHARGLEPPPPENGFGREPNTCLIFEYYHTTSFCLVTLVFVPSSVRH